METEKRLSSIKTNNRTPQSALESEFNRICDEMKGTLLKDFNFKNIIEERRGISISIDLIDTMQDHKNLLIFPIIFYFDLEEKSNLVLFNAKAIYSFSREKYYFSKLYERYICKLISAINKDIKIGALFYEISSGGVYYKINQIFDRDAKKKKIIEQSLDEILTIMTTYGITLFSLKSYLKLIKHHFVAKIKKKTPLPDGLTQEISETIKRLAKEGFRKYKKYRELYFGFTSFYKYDARNNQHLIDFVNSIKNREILEALFSYNFISIKEPEYIKFPNFKVNEEKLHNSVFISNKFEHLKNKIITAPKLLFTFQNQLLELFSINYQIKRRGESFLENFIVSKELSIFYLFPNRSVKNDISILDPSEKLKEEDALIKEIFDCSISAIGREPFDFSIMTGENLDSFIESLILKVEN